MAELKTKVNEGSVNKFLDSIEDEAKRKDSYLLFKMMEKATKNEAKMWGGQHRRFWGLPLCR